MRHGFDTSGLTGDELAELDAMETRHHDTGRAAYAGACIMAERLSAERIRAAVARRRAQRALDTPSESEVAALRDVVATLDLVAKPRLAECDQLNPCDTHAQNTIDELTLQLERARRDVKVAEDGAARAHGLLAEVTAALSRAGITLYTSTSSALAYSNAVDEIATRAQEAEAEAKRWKAAHAAEAKAREALDVAAAEDIARRRGWLAPTETITDRMRGVLGEIVQQAALNRSVRIEAYTLARWSTAIGELRGVVRELHGVLFNPTSIDTARARVLVRDLARDVGVAPAEGEGA